MDFPDVEIQVADTSLDFSIGEIHMGATNIDFSNVEICILGDCLNFSDVEIQTGVKKYGFLHRRNPYMHAYMHIFGLSKYVHVHKQIWMSPRINPSF